MNTFRCVLVAVGLSLASLAATAQEPAAADETERLREEIRDRKEEIRDDRRELRELERERRKRMRPGPVWVNLGHNVAHFDETPQNCYGGQGGISFGKALMVRVQHSEFTYDGYACNAGYGSSHGSDVSALAGFVLGRSGFFLAAGPSWVDIEQTTPGAWGGDTGARYELGWNSLKVLNAPVGFELVLFKNENDVRDFHGVAVNLVIGPRVDGPRRRAAATARPATAR